MFVLGLGAIAILSLAYAGVSAVLEWLRERRAIRALDEPRHPLEGVDERSLGLAVTTFVYGVPRQDVPGSHEDALHSRFGRRSGPLLHHVRRHLDLAVRLATEAGPATSAEVAGWLREQRPYLTADAAESLAAWAVSRPPG